MIRDPSDLPELQRCHYGDLTCITTSLNVGLRELYAGVPRLGVLPFDPLYAHDKLEISNLGDGVDKLVDLDFIFTQNDILGFRHYNVAYLR